MAVSVSITVTVPDSILNDADVRAEIERALKTQTGPELRRQFRKTTEGWEHQPDFSQEFASRSDYLAVKVSTRDEIYGYVNFGTPPHSITPKGSGMLRFQTGYRAATRPGIIASRAKQRSGPVIGAFKVDHPGIQDPREFDQAIAEEIAPDFAADVQEAIQRAASRT